MKRSAWLLVLAIGALLFAQRPTSTQAQVIACPSGIITILVQYKIPVCSPGATSTPTASPTPTPIPTPQSTSTVIDNAIALGAARNFNGADYGFPTSTGNPNIYPQAQFATDLGYAKYRGYGATSDQVAGFNAYSSNANTGFCGAVSDNIDHTAATQAATINAYETAITGSSGNTLANQLLMSCSYYEGQNEWDQYTIANDSLSAGTTAGATVTETSSLSGSSCGTNAYLCAGLYVYINDSSNPEYVLISSVSGSTWTATFQYAHAAGTVDSISPSVQPVAGTTAYPNEYNMAQWQLRTWNNIKNNSSHPEFANLTLGTIPMGNSVAYLSRYDAQEVAITGNHLWSYADAPIWHQGTCNSPPNRNDNPTTSSGWSEGYARTFTFTAQTYSFTKPYIIDEATTQIGDEFAYSIGGGNPYIPANATYCNADQITTATYIPIDTLYVETLGRPIGAMLDPTQFDGNSGNYSNGTSDPSYNPKPVYYSLANTRAFIQDLAYNASTFASTALTYFNPAPTDLCTSYDLTQTTNKGQYDLPSGCTTDRVTLQNQAGTYYVMVVQRLPVGSLRPLHGSAAIACPMPTPTGDPSNYGQCGVAPPTPYPVPTPTTLIYEFLSPAIKHVRVNVQNPYCDIPTNTQLKYTGATPAATPTPIYTHAPNTACFAYVPGPDITPNPTGTMLASIPAGPYTVIIQAGTGSTPLPIVTPIPMRSPRATPTPDANGAVFPWNQYRNGTYNPVVMTP